MTVITIPKKITQRDDLVAIPRKEYEALLEFKKIKEFTATPAQRKSLRAAETNFRKKKTLSYNVLVRKLGFAD